MAEPRTLPSGDTVVPLRLVVRRPAAIPPAGSAAGSAPSSAPRSAPGAQPASAQPTRRVPSFDTIDLACWSSTSQAMALELSDGDMAQVAGALRRRFWRGPAGLASRYEVEVASIRRHR